MLDIRYEPTPNTSNLNEKPYLLVLHLTGGSAKGAVEWLRMTPEERERRTGTKSWSSANAVISREGIITELASPKRATWHCGQKAYYTASKRAYESCRLKDGKILNPNFYSFGLEFAGNYDADYDGILEDEERHLTDRQVIAAVDYIKHLEQTYNIKFTHIITHHDLNSGKPNMELDRDKLMAAMNNEVNTCPTKEEILASATWIELLTALIKQSKNGK